MDEEIGAARQVTAPRRLCSQLDCGVGRIFRSILVSRARRVSWCGRVPMRFLPPPPGGRVSELTSLKSLASSIRFWFGGMERRTEVGISHR
jgi:hypothetical protein